MNRRTTHWSLDGKLHRGTVEGCESCRNGLVVLALLQSPSGPSAPEASRPKRWHRCMDPHVV